MMRKPIVVLFAACLAAAAWAADTSPPIDSTAVKAAEAAAAAAVPDSTTLERELQHLSWEQFKQVVVAVPKLKNGVDAFGPMGWEYVRANYRSYPWKRNIDRLNDSQKIQLAALIEQAKGGASAAGGSGS